ncbi:MAG: SPW repeat domain-containing protein [Chitinophagaceae bacterium]
MWARILSMLIGLGLMITPAVFNFDKIAADNNHIVGPLVITFAVISLWEINRNVRLFNIVTGGWLIISPFILKFSSPALLIDLFSGIAVVIFSFYKGKIKHSYGGGWRSLFQKNPLHIS